MNVVDSSGWLEYFADGPNAQFFAQPLQKLDRLLVPTISLYEVFKRILQQAGEDKALEATAVMMQGHVAPVDVSIALSAAKISHELRIPMADSMILATARMHEAVLWTQDSDFRSIPDVRFIASNKS